MFKDLKNRVARLSEYQDRRLVDVVFAKTIALDRTRLWDGHDALAHTILGVCYAAANNPIRPLRVLDFGGACGYHYLVARAAIPNLEMRWAVVETPAMAERATELATDILRFFSDIDSAAEWLGGVDLMHSLGTLQYTPYPERTLSELCALKSPTLLWSRMNLTEGLVEESVQTSRLADNGPGLMPPTFQDCEIRVHLTKIPLSSFLSAHKRVYDLVWQFHEPVGFLF
jgi:putative methyltransferase (TIGR04325 family)